eukprot:TRINITY_DN2048_c0_g1_i4.p1 TRINITY_DN2048_c0_g1~~TRINITY_DN2048_c0_g1_i4.p1  ORF type:complete len:263 (-),score=26.90 TRINITY_DN2048_c0_g1_i4:445-1233(-)
MESPFHTEKFKEILLSQMKKREPQKTLYLLRTLDKSIKIQIEESINEARLNIQNLPELKNSNIAQHVQILSVRIPKHLRLLNKLCFVTPEYFSKIQKVNVSFVESVEDTERKKYIKIASNLDFVGLDIKSSFGINEISIQSNSDVTISNSKFDGIELDLLQNDKVEISNTTFQNSPFHGFLCQNCDLLIMKNVVVKDFAKDGLYLLRCKNVAINTIFVSGVRDSGFALFEIPKFAIENFESRNCECGFFFIQVGGEINQRQN